MKKIRVAAICVSFLLIVPSFLYAQNDDDREAVTTVVQSLFDAMAGADSAAARSLFWKDGHLVRIQQAADSMNVSVSRHEDFLNGIAGWEPGSVLERMWDPTVMIDDRMAVVWAPYDLHFNGTFSHCGIDVITLIRTGEGWKITDITYTVKQEGCEESLLGPAEQ